MNMSDQEINDFVKGIMDEVMDNIRPELEAKQAKFKEKQAKEREEQEKEDLLNNPPEEPGDEEV